MFFRILWKDLRRKKTINIILLLFIILSTMFVASGLNNVITVANGTDYYLDKAGVGDYIIITMGDDVIGGVEKALKGEASLKGCRIEEVVFGSKEDVRLDGGKISKAKSTLLFQPISASQIKYFDNHNKTIKEVPPGEVYVTGRFLSENGLVPGDVICIEKLGVELTLKVAGQAKDALLGSNFMGNSRFLLNDADMQRILADEEIQKHYQGEIAYFDTDDLAALISAVVRVPNKSFDGSRSTIKLCYVMDLILAFITLILSICLILVSFVVLKFSINFSIEEEFREIGVMKAIGISNRKVRSLYIVKYLCVAAVGAAIGFFLSIPFGALLLKSVTENMYLGNDMGVAANLAGTLLVVAVIIWFAYHCTGKVKNLSPIDAIRSGQTGERYRKKTIYRIGKSHAGPGLYLALNDVVSSPRRFGSVLVSLFICMLLVLLIVNTTATMNSPNLAKTFGVPSDLYITDIADIMKYTASTKEALGSHLEEKADELAALGMPAEFWIEIQYKYTLSFDGKDFDFTCQQGMNTRAEDYEYLQGTAPQSAKEIAITPQISEMTGAKIGDTVTIDYGTEKLDCVVSAYFQTLNQLGKIIRLHEDAPTEMDNVASALQFQVHFTDDPDADEIDRRKERLKEYYGNDEIMNAAEYCKDSTQVADTMETVQYLLLAITLVVVLLVTILTERSFIADEKSQIAILKAIGFNSRSIVRWHCLRFGVVALAAVILAALASIPLTKLCITPIFGLMGAKRIDFNFDFLQMFLLYPGIVLCMTLVSAWLVAQMTRSITSRDTSNIE